MTPDAATPGGRQRRPLRMLFASSEVHGLAKTGGLADVSSALPAALRRQGVDVTVVMPAYRTAVARAGALRRVGAVVVQGQEFGVLSGCVPGTGTPLLMLDAPSLFDRDGGPYEGAGGAAFADNGRRFGLFSEAVAVLAAGRLPALAGYRLLHLNDWQTALAAAHLRRLRPGMPSVFTLHNLAYQGMFDRAEFDALGLDPHWWHPDGVEALGCLSMIKGGINFADAITTVSPTYAREILTAQFGEGLESVIRRRADRLVGIVNGIDTEEWNPATDPLLAQRYGPQDAPIAKSANKRALQCELGLPVQDLPLLAFVGRMAHQKGADIVLAAAGALASVPVQVVVLATGDPWLEKGFNAWAKACPGQVGVRLVHDEALAHRIMAGADMLLMPSRFEPCGLTQMYAHRYGTVPVVRRVGGLADTVTDALCSDGTGFTFDEDGVDGLLGAVHRALEYRRDAGRWRALQARGMALDHGWPRPAQRYARLYERLCAVTPGVLPVRRAAEGRTPAAPRPCRA